MCKIRWKFFGCGPPLKDASDQQGYDIFSGSGIPLEAWEGATPKTFCNCVDPKNHFTSVEESGKAMNRVRMPCLNV